MASIMSLFTGLCGFRQKPPAPGKDDAGERPFSPETTNGKADNLQPKELPEKRFSNVSDFDSEANLELPLPPARRSLQETSSFSNTIMKSSSKKNLNTSLTIQITRAMSMSLRRDMEADGSARRKKKNMRQEKTQKAGNSILVRPIILGEKCRVPDDDIDEDSGVRLQRNRTYHPRSMSSVSMSLSRNNSRIDMNAIPGKEIATDSTRDEGNEGGEAQKQQLEVEKSVQRRERDSLDHTQKKP